MGFDARDLGVGPKAFTLVAFSSAASAAASLSAEAVQPVRAGRLYQRHGRQARRQRDRRRSAWPVGWNAKMSSLCGLNMNQRNLPALPSRRFDAARDGAVRPVRNQSFD